MSNDTHTLTLAEFLLARIAEDEDAAKGVNRGLWNSRVALLQPDLYGLVIRQYPERVLAECEAKRRVVHYLMSCEEIVSVKGGDLASGMLIAARHAARSVAAVYADHPDYREEWKP